MKTRMMIMGFVVGVLMVGTALAHEGEKGKENESHEAMPSSIPGIWEEIQEHEAMLKETIAAGKLDQVHETAYEVRDMVKALSSKSTTLAPESLKNVKSGSERIAEIASQLDNYGDAGDKAKTQEQFQKLTKELAFIQSQYPAGVLGAKGSPAQNQPVIYTCPMHPEVQQPAPGNCPKCGMKLQPKK